jgi:hypothetical protein
MANVSHDETIDNDLSREKVKKSGEPVVLDVTHDYIVDLNNILN